MSRQDSKLLVLNPDPLSQSATPAVAPKRLHTGLAHSHAGAGFHQVIIYLHTRTTMCPQASNAFAGVLGAKQ
jgi:hypothetical protein